AGVDPPLGPMRLEPPGLVHFVDLHGENTTITRAWTLGRRPIGHTLNQVDGVKYTHVVMRRFASLLLPVAVAGLLPAQDPYCPRYPSAVRSEMEQSLDLDRQAQEYQRAIRLNRTAAPSKLALADSASFIDKFIARKMAADAVTPAPRSSDAE